MRLLLRSIIAAPPLPSHAHIRWICDVRLLTTNANTTINTNTFSSVNTARRGSAMAPTLKHKLRQASVRVP